MGKPTSPSNLTAVTVALDEGPTVAGPVSVSPGKLSVGSDHMCCGNGLTQHTWCWGSNDDGETGDPSLQIVVPEAPVQLFPDAYSVTAGDATSCVITKDSDLGDVLEDPAGELRGGVPLGNFGRHSV